MRITLRAWAVLMMGVVALMASEPQIELNVDRTTVAVGDPVNVTLVYRWPTSWTPLVEPDPSLSLAAVFVEDLPPVIRADSSNEQRRTFRIRIIATHSGTWELPRPTLNIRPASGAFITIEAPRVLVQVGAGSATVALPAPRPALVRPPSPLVNEKNLWWVVGGAVLLATLTSWLWWRYRRQHPQGPGFALVADRALTAALAVTDPRAAATAISLALRRYIGCQCHIDAAATTSRELQQLLRLHEQHINNEERTSVMSILNRLDDVRWAPGEVPADLIAHVVAQAREWVRGVESRLAAQANNKEMSKEQSKESSKRTP